MAKDTQSVTPPTLEQIWWNRPIRRRCPTRWNWLFCVALALVAILALYRGPGPRVGDGYDYYIMLMSWAENGTPYSTPRVGRIYESYVAERDDGGSFPEYFPGWPPSDRVEPQHFWFYSLAAMPFYWPLKLLGLDVGLSFTLLHLVLLCTAVHIANRRLGRLAALCVILLAVGSPAWWFVDKAHTEFFTVMTTTTAMVFFLCRRYVSSSVWFAVAAAQNPALAVLALTVLACAFAKHRWRLFSRHKWGLLPTIALLGIQPVYCLVAHGTLTAIGATDIRMWGPVYHLRCLAAYWVDPDIGMLCNWWLALPTAATFFLLCAGRVIRFRAGATLLALAALLVLGLSHTLTANVNHGGTVHISRYCLSYLFLFFAMQWHLMVWLAGVRRPAFWSVLIVGVAMGGFSAWQYRPGRPGVSRSPTAVSDLVYANLPGLYDPLPDVFYRRHGGKVVPMGGENCADRSVWTTWAVSDRSGNKILIHAKAVDFADPLRAPPVAGCPRLDPAAVCVEARRHMAQHPEMENFYLSGLGDTLKVP